MKSSLLRWLLPIVTALLFAVLATPVRLAAQEQMKLHHHYQLIDIGTFGGPESFFNNLNLTDRFFFSTAFYQFAQVRNQRGTFVGFADTATPDPFSPFCYVPDCFVTHAFRWEKGNKIDLGALPGGASSAAFWINAHGVIVGNAQNGQLDPIIPGLPQIHATLWQDGSITDLGTLGGSQSYAEAINNRGQVTGLSVNTIPDPFSFHYLFLYGSLNGTQARGFLWDKDEGMQDLGTLGGPDTFPNLINERGQVAGFSYTNSIPNADDCFPVGLKLVCLPTLDPFLWDPKTGMKDLGNFGDQAASVNGLNNRGEVVGGLWLPGNQQIHPFLWDGEKLIDLIALPFAGTANGEAAWINEGGEVAGIAGLPLPCPGGQSQVQHAFLWRNGDITDLGTVAGTPNSQASFINSRTQIVGLSFACDFSVFNAILWEDGSMVDLNTLIPANSPFHLYSASFIDDQGQIAAFGILANGDTHAVLLIPCDENHNGNSECEEDAESTVKDATNPRPNAVLPENLRMQLRQRFNPWHRFTSLGAPRE